MASALSSAAMAARPAGPAVTLCSASPLVSQQQTGSSKPALPKPVPPSPYAPAPVPPIAVPPVRPAFQQQQPQQQQQQQQQQPQQLQYGRDVAAAKLALEQGRAPPVTRLVLNKAARDPPPTSLRLAGRIRTPEADAASVQSLDQILNHVEKGFQSELLSRQQQAGPSSSSDTSAGAPAGTSSTGPGGSYSGSPAGSSYSGPPAGSSYSGPPAGSSYSGPPAGSSYSGPPTGTSSGAPAGRDFRGSSGAPPGRDFRSRPSAAPGAPWRPRVDEPRVNREPTFGAAPPTVGPVPPPVADLNLNGIQTDQGFRPEPRRTAIVKPVLPRRPAPEGPYAPPPRPGGVLQRPTPPPRPAKPGGPILRDIGAAPQPPTRPPPSGASNGPILRDVGAAPRPKAVDPVLATAAVAVPPKFTKAAPAKGKEDWRKKASANAAVDGANKRKTAGVRAKNADGTGDIDSPGVGLGRGRKFTKATRKAARNEAARAAAPVKVDILEVGKQGLSVAELASKLAVNEGEVVKALFLKGIPITVNQILDEDTVKLVCNEFDVEVIEAGVVEIKDLAKKGVGFVNEGDLDSLQVRPPVVTVMGHVDHGKTSLLDYIRRAKVAASEAGGITQGIGAYRVPVEYGGGEQSCVFIDTPGHEAFSAMRARGARVTDIAIIVVAADDGVRPQTLEAIAHAKAAKVPMVFALNKCDKEGANPERVKQELANKGILPEEWGGDTPMVQVSALTGDNIDALLENVMLVAEFQELKANPASLAKGTVLESSLDKSRGVLSTLLVQNGTLRQGDVVLSGESYGKVRALLDDTGARVDEAGPSTAVQVIGLSRVPLAGDSFEVLTSLDEARERADEQADLVRVARLAAQAGEGKVTLTSGATNQATGMEKHQLNVILKVDAQGSIEPIREALQALPQNTVSLRFLTQEAGDISTSEIDLAVASEALVLGFNVGLQPGVQTQADTEGVSICVYRVIYDLVDEVRKRMEGLLNVVQEQVSLGKAEVRAVFGSGSSKVAGCIVTEGKLVKGCSLSVSRGGNIVHTGTLDSLRRVKESAKEVVAGLECGVGVDDFLEWKEGDLIDAYNLVEKKRSLEEAAVTTAALVAGNSQISPASAG